MVEEVRKGIIRGNENIPRHQKKGGENLFMCKKGVAFDVSAMMSGDICSEPHAYLL